MSKDAEIARCNQRISTTNSQISSTEFKYRIDDNLDRINNKVNLAEALSKLLGNEKFLATIAKDSNVDDFFWKVMTKLDDNTINIWRAIASVPLQSSKVVQTKGKRAENVTIMPLKNKELVQLINDNVTSSQLITNINNSFSTIPQEFDLSWRESILAF